MAAFCNPFAKRLICPGMGQLCTCIHPAKVHSHIKHIMRNRVLRVQDRVKGHFVTFKEPDSSRRIYPLIDVTEYVVGMLDSVAKLLLGIGETTEPG